MKPEGAAGAAFFMIALVIVSAFAAGANEPGECTLADPSPSQPDAGIEATFDIPVQLGWNFISVPLVQWNESVLEVLDDNGGDTTWDTARWYDQSYANGSYRTYFKGWTNLSWNSLTGINHTIGFLVNITDAGTDSNLTVNGTLPGTVAIALKAGLNMVGYPSIEDSDYTVADLKAETNVTSVQNVTGVNYTDAYVLQHGEGYWIDASQDCVWTLDNAPLGAAPTITLMSPANNSVFQPGIIIDLDVNGSATLDASLNGGAWTTFNAPHEIDTDAWTDGVKVLYVRAQNANGSVSASFNFTIDSVEPDIDLASPVEGSQVRVGDILHFNITEENLATANCTAGAIVVNITAPFDVDTTGWADGYADIVVSALDMAGNSRTEEFSFTFDGTAPQVDSTNPDNGSASVRADASLVIYFSEEMDRNATQSAVSISPSIDFEGFSWNADSDQLTVDIDGNLTQNRRYTVTVGMLARDAVGNPLATAYQWEFTTWLDTDGDGSPNTQDQDDDGDGVLDPIDKFPLDPTESVDTDLDGIGDNADLDDDDDGVADVTDAFPLDRYESLDSDDDGLGDNQDEFPNDPTETVDSDGDGLGDNEDFLPYFNNYVFYSIAIMAPCITAILVALIVSRSRRARKAKSKEAGEPKKADDDAHKDEMASDDVEEREEISEPAPKKFEPQDPMAPPPED